MNIFFLVSSIFFFFFPSEITLSLRSSPNTQLLRNSLSKEFEDFSIKKINDKFIIIYYLNYLAHLGKDETDLDLTLKFILFYQNITDKIDHKIPQLQQSQMI